MIEWNSPRSYEIEDDHEPGDPAFEVMIMKIGANRHLVRQIVRENYRLKQQIKELNDGARDGREHT